jgi:hypothetical protein
MVKIVLFLVLFVTEIIVGSDLFYIIAITEENFINQYWAFYKLDSFVNVFTFLYSYDTV